jgi:hypothetical protein
MSKWSIPLAELAEKVKADLETVARKSTLEVFAAVVARSPVGNPDIWKSNSHRAFARQHSNTLATIYNDRVKADVRSYTKGGKLKVKLKRVLSAKALRAAYPNVSGKGYVGGRFRANWNVSYGSIDTSVTNSTSATRGTEEAQKALSLDVGGVVYMTNSLRYAKRLEDGYSTQAPTGMVRLSAMEFSRRVQEALKK